MYKRQTWNCLAPWNAISVDLAPSDVCSLVNKGETTFTEQYREVAERTLALLEFAQDDPFSYGYNDACTAFARGESAMFVIGSYAVPQIQSVNPDINIAVSYTHLDVYKRQEQDSLLGRLLPVKQDLHDLGQRLSLIHI